MVPLLHQIRAPKDGLRDRENAKDAIAMTKGLLHGVIAAGCRGAERLVGSRMFLALGTRLAAEAPFVLYAAELSNTRR